MQRRRSAAVAALRELMSDATCDLLGVYLFAIK